MENQNFSTMQFLKDFNHSDFRKRNIPMELVLGWPCVQRMGKTLCMTIPYYARASAQNRIALFPLYCSVTVPLANPERIMDFTLYPHQKEWQDLDYTKPVGYFKHKALADVKTRGEYQALCEELYGLYDEMIANIRAKEPFAKEEKMIELFTKLMEPGQFAQYQRINKRFYSYFCRL